MPDLTKEGFKYTTTESGVIESYVDTNLYTGMDSFHFASVYAPGIRSY